MQVAVQVVVVPASHQSAPSASARRDVSLPLGVVSPPHDLLVQRNRLQLPVNVVLVAVLGGVGERPDLDLPLGDPAHVVVLNGDPVHQGPEDLILDLLDAAVLVKVFGVSHHRRGDDLRQSAERQRCADESATTVGEIRRLGRVVPPD